MHRSACTGPAGAREDTRAEVDRLMEERDETEQQLRHIKTVSQMVIEEVSVLQNQLEIEKSCRENAEALAAKLNCENRKLKCPGLTAADDCADAADSNGDTFTEYRQQVTELRDTVNSLLQQNKSFVCQLHQQQQRIEELTTQIEKEQEEVKQLQEKVEEQNQTIRRFNRVSSMAAQEYDDMMEKLQLEQNLRLKAESYAHQMLVKQKEANRRSALLLQSSDPSVQLLKALEDVANVTRTLEEERRLHQQEVRSSE